MKRPILLTTFVLAAVFVACSGATDPATGDIEHLEPDTGEHGEADVGVDADGPPLWDGLVINEVAAAGEPADWFELFNAGDRPIELSGYFFTDDIADRPQRGSFPADLVIEPFGYEVIYMDDDWPGFKLAKDEELAIFAPDGAMIDSVDWDDGDSPEGMSYARIPNGIGPFVTVDTPTPGAANVDSGAQPTCGDDQVEDGEVCDGDDLDGLDCQALGFIGGELRCEADCQGYDLGGCETAADNIVINEVTSKGDDEIELYNRGQTSVDLTGWYVTDDEPDQDGHVYRFEDGTTLDAGDFLVLVKGDHHEFGLGSDDHVALHAPDGQTVDLVAWIDHEADPSLCRIPDGTGEFRQCSTSTFGGPNAP